MIIISQSSYFKDLQQVISQAEALAKVRQMKTMMTPRVPPIHHPHIGNTTPLVENEVVVSTTTEHYTNRDNTHCNSIDFENTMPLIAENEVVISTTPKHYNDTNSFDSILNNSDVVAWIAKARLRPRPPIKYTEKKRRRSHSRSSSVHE